MGYGPHVTGETDLAAMLASLSVTRRTGAYTVVTVPAGTEPGPDAAATIAEDEGLTVVVAVEVAEARGWTIEFSAAWLTIDVHSSLSAVGLTAALSRTLTEQDIPCNVLAGYFHDHLLVPIERVDDAVTAIENLAS